MKKIIILASALVLGGTAYAQDASMQPPTSGSSTPAATPDASAPGSSMPSQSPDGSMPAASGSSTPSTPDSSMPASGGGMPASGGGMPASGGGMPASGGGTGAATPSTTDQSNLPTCSKTVTDSCKQGSGGGMHHKAMHKKRK